MSDSQFEIRGSGPMEIAKRFSSYAGIVLFASFMYWLLIACICFALARSRLGDETARIVAIVVGVVFVCGGMAVYIRWICKELSKSRLVVGLHSFTIAAHQKLSVNEYEFPFDRTKRIVFGQPLNGMESLCIKLNEIGASRVSMAINEDIKGGRLFVDDCNGRRVSFQFIDKAFSEADLLRFFAALDAKGVVVELGE